MRESLRRLTADERKIIGEYLKSPMAIRSNFDDFLKQQRIYEGCTLRALKRVLAWQIAEAMKAEGLTKAELARRMRTSRAVLDRLLDAKNPSATLNTITRAASALGRRIRLELAA